MLCNGPESENHFLLHFLLRIIWKCNRETNQRANILTGVASRDAYASKKCTVYPLWPWGKLLVISSLWRADRLSTRFSKDLFVFSPEVVWRGTWFEARPLSVREAVRHQNGYCIFLLSEVVWRSTWFEAWPLTVIGRCKNMLVHQLLCKNLVLHFRIWT